MTTTPMVEIIGPKKSFGRNEILHDVSLTVAPGSVTCLVGPSGSGKTTLLRGVNQLETFESGVIRVDGELVGATTIHGRMVASRPKDLARSRRHTGMVFQRFNLFRHRTVLENVIEGPVQILRRPRAEVVEEGHPHEILRNPGRQRTRDFLARVP